MLRVVLRYCRLLRIPQRAEGCLPQARELEAKHLPEVLTNDEKHDIMNIRLDDIKTAVTGSPISEEVAEYIFSVLAEQRD